MKPRVGFGYDTHSFTEEKPLKLGGILIEEHIGLKGHSDADVLIHAICDAILGAANLRDIGYHFSDKDPQWIDADSKLLLANTCNMIRKKNFYIGNIDATICTESPKINPYIDKMKYTLSNVMEISEADISIKATTNEKMGYVGREEGINAYAVAIIIQNTI